MLMRSKYSDGFACSVDEVALVLRLLPTTRTAVVTSTFARGEHFLNQLVRKLGSSVPVGGLGFRRTARDTLRPERTTGFVKLFIDDPQHLNGLEIDLLVFDADARSEVLGMAQFRLEVTK